MRLLTPCIERSSKRSRPSSPDVVTGGSRPRRRSVLAAAAIVALATAAGRSRGMSRGTRLYAAEV